MGDEQTCASSTIITPKYSWLKPGDLNAYMSVGSAAYKCVMIVQLHGHILEKKIEDCK
jgi:hypothetical protein